ncbi:MAG TPA: dual specificity protein phosphatase family protein [Tepidisphaeraceae bacterium]|nr:dual specificity protein phosphatase family protein [Tepidisphaeraceae bacterium]
MTEPPPGTKAVLNLCESADPYRVEFHRWDAIPDAAPAPSIEWLARQVTFVEAQRQAGHGVYIHCAGGISRAGLVTAAYLMRRQGWSRDETIRYLRTKRPGVSPNPAFMALLSEWQNAVKHPQPTTAATQP